MDDRSILPLRLSAILCMDDFKMLAEDADCSKLSIAMIICMRKVAQSVQLCGQKEARVEAIHLLRCASTVSGTLVDLAKSISEDLLI
jgi:hypothetical protein